VLERADKSSELQSEEEGLDALHARLARLERERGEEIRGAMAAAAAAQERLYWLDRWHVDLNALVATRAGGALRMVMRALRAPTRWIRLLARRLR
jgi:hypothetical protein